MADLSIEPIVAPSARDRVNRWFALNEVPWELFMAALAVLFVAVGFAADELPAGSGPAIFAAEWVLSAFFLGEFAVRLTAAPRRLDYLRAHWIDAIALAPPVRGARILRLLRLLRLVRSFAGVYRALLHLESLARHRGFAWLLAAWLGVMVLCSAALYMAENGSADTTVSNPFDALWWGIVTLTTVGYGDVYPVTPEGRLAAMALMLLGILLFSAITATITSYLLSHGRDRAPADRGTSLAEELDRIAQLHSRGRLTDQEFAVAKSMCLKQFDR